VPSSSAISAKNVQARIDPGSGDGVPPWQNANWRGSRFIRSRGPEIQLEPGPLDSKGYSNHLRSECADVLSPQRVDDVLDPGGRRARDAHVYL
jgi:hypothetical protein